MSLIAYAPLAIDGSADFLFDDHLNRTSRFQSLQKE
jgi:hypothetical protein